MSNCCFKRSFEAQMTNISIYCKSLCWRLRHKSDYPILSSGSLTHSWKATSIWAPKKESTVTRRRSIDQRWIPDEPRGSCKLLGLCHVTLKMPRPPPPPIHCFSCIPATRHQSKVLVSSQLPTSSKTTTQKKRTRDGEQCCNPIPVDLTAALVLAEQHTSLWYGVSGSEPGHSIPLTYWNKMFLPCA